MKKLLLLGALLLGSIPGALAQGNSDIKITQRKAVGNGTETFWLVDPAASAVLVWNDTTNRMEWGAGGAAAWAALTGSPSDSGDVGLTGESLMFAATAAAARQAVNLDTADTVTFAGLNLSSSLNYDGATISGNGAEPNNGITATMEGTGIFTVSGSGGVTITNGLLALGGTGTLNGLDAIDATTETTLEAALDLDALQGAVTDAQVPDNITINLAAAVTTNANLTGPVTSIGNATSFADDPTFVGILALGDGTTGSGVLRIDEDDDDGANFASFQVPALAANTIYTLPPDDGDAGEQLQTDGAGVLTWEAAGGLGSALTSTTDDITSTAGLNLVTAGANNLVMKLGDAAGAQKLSITDSADAEVAFIDSDGNQTVTGLSATTFTFTDADTSPVSVGEFAYDNLVTGLDDGALVWHDDDEVQTLVALDSSEVLEAGDDAKVLRYNWNAGLGFFDLVAQSGGTAFSALTSGTNTAAAMVAGTGSSIAASGTGTIVATGVDAVGAAAITVGSADVTSLTVTTDGTGTAEVALPTGSIDGAEILDNTISFLDIASALTPEAATNIVGADTLAGNPAFAAGGMGFRLPSSSIGGLIFEGAADTIEGLLTHAAITGSDKTWTLPNTTGTLITTGGTGTVTGTMILDATVAVADLATSAVRTATFPTVATYTVGTTDPKESYGGVIYVTNAAHIVNLPAVAVGMSVTVISEVAGVVDVNPNGTEVIKLDGVAAAAGENIRSPGAIGDQATFIYRATGTWHAATNSWVEETP